MSKADGCTSVVNDEKKPPLSPMPLKNVTTRKTSDVNAKSYQLLNERLNEQDELIRNLIADVKEKNGRILDLEQRLLKVEAEQVKTDSLLFIKDVVSKQLSKRINQLEQYTRRYSVVVKGVAYERNEKFDKLKDHVQKIIEAENSETTMDDVDKFHRNGPRVGSDQDVIVRFKSHSAKETYYNNRKKMNLGAIKVQPSLSPATKNLLGQANDLVASYTEGDAHKNRPDFVFADVHGNLLVKMVNRTDKGMFFRFDNLVELSRIVANNNCTDHAEVTYDKLMQKLTDEDGDLPSSGLA